MIAPAKKCGCPENSDFPISHNLTFSPIPQDDSNQHSEKCVCPKPTESGYQKLKGACDICCEGNIELENEDTREDIEEEKSKVFSEIVEKGLPYKEIEAIINDNRMIIRVQKDSITYEEWEPPCDCIEENEKTLSKQIQSTDKNRNDISFRKVDLNHSRNPCRTVTVYPQPDSEIYSEPNFDISSNEIDNELKVTKAKNLDPSEAEKKNQESIMKSIDLEENPNIFLLRIKKRCENEDGKYNIDLEFRTPRPWLTKPIVEKPPPLIPTVTSEVIEKVQEKKEKKAKKRKKGKK